MKTGLPSDVRLRLSRAVRALAKHRNEEGLPRRAIVDFVERSGEAGAVLVDFGDLGDAPVVWLAEDASGQDDAAELLALLSPREQEVAALIALGAANKEIAAALFISLPTVKDHVHAVLRKTGLKSRTEVAARLAGQAKKSPPAKLGGRKK